MTKNVRKSDKPTITSGMTKGALTMPTNRVRPLNRRYFTRANAAKVPRTTELQAVMKAIFIDSHRPDSTSWSCSSAAYHFSVKPPQTEGSAELLNEYRISVTIGRNKNR